MKLETRKRSEEGHWSEEEPVTSVLWQVSSLAHKKKVEEVNVYLLNEQKRMLVLTFRDVKEVREFVADLLKHVEPRPAGYAEGEAPVTPRYPRESP